MTPGSSLEQWVFVFGPSTSLYTSFPCTLTNKREGLYGGPGPNLLGGPYAPPPPPLIVSLDP